ncbi:MAG: polyamine aminopropyltransferase [Candidatus Aminicenantales bacterium]
MVKPGFYFIEPFTEDFLRILKVEKVLFQGRTRYQLVHCFKSRIFGKMLFLDGKIQSAQVDEFVFHETLVHPALLTHPRPKKVLILGGGEGATLREVLRHSCVQRATMLDLDQELVEVSRRHLPEWSQGAFLNPRAKILFREARGFVEKTKQKFDLVISDLTEPLRETPSVPLFTKEFFSRVDTVLNDDGVFVLQAGSADPHYFHFFGSCVKTLIAVFPVVRPYWTFMFSFSLPWGFVLASKNKDPLQLGELELRRRLAERKVRNLRFYRARLHQSLFILPRYLEQAIQTGRVLSDKDPFIWEA